MGNTRAAMMMVALTATAVTANVRPMLAQPLNVTQISPRNLLIRPFGYGPVTQFLGKPGGGTGLAQCRAISSSLTCLSVSGGSSCSAPAPQTELVSCGAPRPPVNETAFQPVNCNGQPSGDNGVSGLINSDDFCLIAGYMPSRTVDTLYQYDDYVRLGVNRRFGGTVFELYGADKLDRILQNTGGAMQLSLWALTAQYASAQYPRASFAVSSTSDPNWRTDFSTVAYSNDAACQAANPRHQCQTGAEGPNLLSAGSPVFPCGGNGSGAATPFNPLQSQSGSCDIGGPAGYVDSVSSPQAGVILAIKSNPANYTRSDMFQGLTWTQTSQVVGPYALLTYQMLDNGNFQDTSFQEIPAIILHDGMNAFAYYYTGNKPYADVNGPFSRLTMAQGALVQLQFPSRPGPFGVGSSAVMTEDWISTCDAAEQRCFTIASFSPSAQDLIVSNTPAAPYFGVHGFFSLTNQLRRSVTVAVFPYRIDDVVEGQTIRQWIYQMRGKTTAHAHARR